MAFVSLTNMPKASVEQFVQQFTVPWPCGYGATTSTIACIGAFNRNATIPGYELTPTLYLVGADGRIRWNSQARLNHQEPGPLLHELEAQIEQVLAGPAFEKAKAGAP